MREVGMLIGAAVYTINFAVSNEMENFFKPLIAEIDVLNFN